MFYKNYDELIEAMKVSGNLGLSATIMPRRDSEAREIYCFVKEIYPFGVEDGLLKINVNDSGEFIFELNIEQYNSQWFSGPEILRIWDLIEFDHICRYARTRPQMILAWFYYRHDMKPEQELFDNNEDFRSAYNDLPEYLDKLHSINDEQYEIYMRDKPERSN